MSNVATKSLVLSQPKVSQGETNPAPSLPFTITTTESHTEVRVEIPGVDPSTVSVDFEAGSLSVACDRGELTIPVDPTVDPSKIKADILWGLLTVAIPLPTLPESRTIKISVHDAVKSAPKASTKFTAAD